jgi:hypothetical protein
LADLLVEFALLGVGLLADLLAARCRNTSGKPGQGLLLPASHLSGMDAKYLRDLRGGLVRLDGLHGDLGLQAGRVISCGFGALTLLHFQCRPPSEKGCFRVQKSRTTSTLWR